MNARKNFCILLVSIFASTASIAQKQNQPVPQLVAAQFNSAYSHIRQVEWSAADNNRYQAQFKDKGVLKKVVYSDAGQWLVIESPAAQQDFPQAVSRSLSQNFSGYQVSQATRMELFGKGVAFRIRIRKGNGSLEVEMDMNGQVRRQVEVVEVYEEHSHPECHHHHCDHHAHCDHHKHKEKHKHTHGKGHKHHRHN